MTTRGVLGQATERVTTRRTQTVVSTERKQGRETKAGRLAALAVALDASLFTHVETVDPFDPPRGPEDEEIPEGIAGIDDEEDDHVSDDDKDTKASVLRREHAADIVFGLPGHRLPPRQSGRSVADPPLGLSCRVRRGSVDVETDPLLLSRLDRQEAWLQRVADALVKNQRDSVLAATSAEAFEALQPWTQKAMAVAAATTVEELSRNSWRVVATAGGARLPLAFFWWKKPDQADLLRPIQGDCCYLAGPTGSRRRRDCSASRRGGSGRSTPQNAPGLARGDGSPARGPASPPRVSLRRPRCSRVRTRARLSRPGDSCGRSRNRRLHCPVASGASK